jgi:hypothetical protein
MCRSLVNTMSNLVGSMWIARSEAPAIAPATSLTDFGELPYVQRENH